MAEPTPAGRTSRPVRTWPIAVLLAIILIELVAVVAVVRWDPPSGAEELAALYATPTPLPARKPGTPIRVWMLPMPEIDGTVYGILYHSRSVAGRDIAVSGYLAIPNGPAPAGGRPIVAVAHGTVGGADHCAPSRRVFGDAHTINPFLAKGWIVASTDLEGIGGTGPHPYLVGTSEGRSMIDAVRAARALLPDDTSDEYAAWGISQGGHAALFTRELAATWAPELKLVGVVGMAPVSDVAGFVASPTIVPQGITLLAVSGYTAAYPSLRASQVLAVDGLHHLSDVQRDCLAELNNTMDDSPLSTLRVADPLDVPAWKAALEENAAGLVPSFTPVLLVQGTEDPIVPPSETTTLFDRLCHQGAWAELDVVTGADHLGIIESGRSTYLSWLDDRFAGRDAVTNCQPLT